jgi:hypothetical protein
MGVMDTSDMLLVTAESASCDAQFKFWILHMFFYIFWIKQ